MRWEKKKISFENLNSIEAWHIHSMPSHNSWFNYLQYNLGVCILSQIPPILPQMLPLQLQDTYYYFSVDCNRVSIVIKTIYTNAFGCVYHRAFNTDWRLFNFLCMTPYKRPQLGPSFLNCICNYSSLIFYCAFFLLTEQFCCAMMLIISIFVETWLALLLWACLSTKGERYFNEWLSAWSRRLLLQRGNSILFCEKSCWQPFEQRVARNNCSTVFYVRISLNATHVWIRIVIIPSVKTLYNYIVSMDILVWLALHIVYHFMLNINRSDSTDIIQRGKWGQGKWSCIWTSYCHYIWW